MNTGLPVRAVLKRSGLYVVRQDIAASQLRDAFMQETVVRNRAADELVEIGNAELGTLAPQQAPAGLIFHVARCGSTLVSQLLKQHGGAIVYAEPLPINEILAPPQIQERARIVAALRSLSGMFAQHAGGPFVVKLSSWNTLYCDLVTAAFPDTPWVFCVRDPLEVAVSLRNQPPAWVGKDGDTANPFAKIVEYDDACRTPDTYVARLYAAFCSAAARLDPRLGRLIHYDQLPTQVWECVAPHFGLDVNLAARARMQNASRDHAKSPLDNRRDFSPDGPSKRAEATPALHLAIDAIARPALAQLQERLA